MTQAFRKWFTMPSRDRVSPVARLVALTAGCAIALAACATGQSGASPTPQPSPSVRELLLPRSGLYSDAVRFGDLVWTAGHLPEGVDVDAPIEDQVNQALDNLEATLEEAGAGFDTVIKANVYLTDFEDWEGFNSVFFERLSETGLPARTTVAVRELGFGYKVEIELVAHVRDAAD